MRVGILAVLVTAASVGVAAGADIPAHHRHHPMREVFVPPAPIGPFGWFPEPAHMVQVRPGYWISNYDCVTDEGQGRYLPCDMGGSR
jgi:hypothetical protein